MKTISVGQLRQNPTAALDAVERGESFEVTRHRRVVGRLVPPRSAGTSAEAVLAVLRETPLERDWAAELAAQRGDFDHDRDPWAVE